MDDYHPYYFPGVFASDRIKGKGCLETEGLIRIFGTE